MDEQFLDDDPKAIEEAEIAEAEDRKRAAGLSPHQFATGAIEFQGLAQALVAQAIAFGQTRRGFLTSLADRWDTYLPAYKVLRRAQERLTPEQGKVKVTATFEETNPDRVAQRVAADLANVAGPADQAPPAYGVWERRPDGAETLRAPTAPAVCECPPGVVSGTCVVHGVGWPK